LGTQAISLFNDGYHLSLSNGTLQKDSCWKHFLSPSYHRAEIQKIVDHIQPKILEPSPERDSYLCLGDALIQRYRHDNSVKKIVQIFDRQIAPFRAQLRYLHPANQKSLSKWEKAGQPLEIFRDFPRFSEFLKASLLLSQMKVTRDAVRLIDDEPALLVEDEWVKEGDLYRRFEVVDSKAFGARFIVEKETREVYTYLDNGRGLQKHHPFYSTNTPLSTLNDDEYEKTRDRASLFVRSDEADLTPQQRAERNEGRPFILQYVTSRVKEGDSNFNALIRNPKHPYLRLIIGQDNPEMGTKKGEVYEVGYGWKEMPLLPFMASKGRFRSPDPWEYKTPDQRIVTNIPISQEEARRFYEFTMKYHRDSVNLGIEPGFSLSRQNCSVYSREACKAAGVDIPTEIDLKEAIQRVVPDCLRKVGQQLREWTGAASTWIRKGASRFLPACLIHGIQRLSHLIGKVRDAFLAFALTPFHALLGGAFGKGGAAFRQPGQPPAQINPPLHDWRNFFSLSSYKINLPGIAQEWQLKQPSTVVYDKPVRLAIVPT
jgi:hypothetical protein